MADVAEIPELEQVHDDYVSGEGESAPDAEGTQDAQDAGDDEKELEEMKKRVQEMEEEARKLKEMQEQVESLNAGSTINKEEADARSVYVGNVDYSSTAEELQLHFQACGTINRVTILCDKWTGHPKGYAYIEFLDPASVTNAVQLNDSTFKGRQLKVIQKRTNIPGAAPRGGRGRGRGGYGAPYGGGFRPRGRGGFRGGRRPYGGGYHPYYQ